MTACSAGEPLQLNLVLCRRECNIHAPDGINLDLVMKDVLRLARKHGVTIDSSYASLVIAVTVIVGFATSLDPKVGSNCCLYAVTLLCSSLFFEDARLRSATVMGLHFL